MRIINFCADGIKNAAQKGFFSWVSQQDADVICIQDLRCQEYELSQDIFYPQGYFPYFFDNMEGTNGVAIYTRKLPKAIMTGLGFVEFDQQARYIQADFDKLSIGSILVPPTIANDPTSVEQRALFLDSLKHHLDKIRHKRRDFILAGNWQIARNNNDIAKEVGDNTPGFLPAERRWIDDVIHQLGYVDSFRQFNTDDDEFSWWPENDAENNAWRVDFQLASRSLQQNVEYGVIYKNQSFSSHAPVAIDYEYPFEDDLF